MDIAGKIREAGIVGAGGAGFPTHVKVNCKAEYVIANGAECEPLLRVDQQVMQYYADGVVEGLLAVMEQTEMCIRDSSYAKITILKSKQI